MDNKKAKEIWCISVKFSKIGIGKFYWFIKNCKFEKFEKKSVNRQQLIKL